MEVEFKALWSYYKKKWKFLMISSLFMALIGFMYILYQTPKHDVSVILKANEDSQQSILGGSGVISSLVGGSNATKVFSHSFKETFYSLEATKNLENKKNYIFRIYGDLYDESEGDYREIYNLDSILKKIKFWFIGISYQYKPNIYMLNDYIKATISVKYVSVTNFLVVSSLSSNPSFSKEVIETMLIETDNLFKSRDKYELDAKISYLYDELDKSKEVEQINSVSRLLQTELLKRSLIDSGATYRFKIIRDFEISEYPTYPNFSFLFLLFTFFGFFGSLAYQTYIFIFKSPES